MGLGSSRDYARPRLTRGGGSFQGTIYGRGVRKLNVYFTPDSGHQHGLPRRSGVPSVKALSVSLEMVGRIGIEPMTNGLKVQCSTN